MEWLDVSEISHWFIKNPDVISTLVRKLHNMNFLKFILVLKEAFDVVWDCDRW